MDRPLTPNLFAGSDQVLGVEHALGATQNRVLGRVVGMVLGGNLQDSWNGSGVRVNDVTDQLSQVLVDQDDVDVITLDESLEAVLQLAHGRVWKGKGISTWCISQSIPFTHSCPRP